MGFSGQSAVPAPGGGAAAPDTAHRGIGALAATGIPAGQSASGLRDDAHERARNRLGSMAMPRAGPSMHSIVSTEPRTGCIAMNQVMRQPTVQRSAARASSARGSGGRCRLDRTTYRWEIGGLPAVPDPPFAEATGVYGEGVPTVRAWTRYGRPVYTFAGRPDTRRHARAHHRGAIERIRGDHGIGR